MTFTRRKLLQTLAVLGPALTLARGATAQEPWPSKPIRFIVGFAPGGGADITARVIALKLSEQLGQTVVVENLTGASGTIGMARLAKLPADGYSIGMGQSINLITSPLLYKEVKFDPVQDFTPVARLVNINLLFFVRNDSPYRSLNDLLAAARDKPGSITYGSGGVGSTLHLAGELLAKQAKVNMVHVPFRGGGPALAAVLGGDINFVITSYATGMSHLRAGAIRAVATTGRNRHRLLPEVPAIAESLPDYPEVFEWLSIVAPAGLPAALQERLAAEAKKALAAPDVVERLAKLALDVGFAGPAEFARVIAGDIALWGPLIKGLGITATD